MQTSDDALRIENLSHWYGDFRVLNQINLRITPGQIVALVGPSGCGKSTLLKAILGTHPANEGRILVDGNQVRTPSRNVGIVYQHYSLFDFLTAEANVAFGLKLDESSLAFRMLMIPQWLKMRAKHIERARAFLDSVKLGAACGKYPAELSGGMRQRVAIAQALILKPKLVLLDEPFGALDEATRESLQMMLLGFYQENLKAKQEGRTPEYTILIVTHELNEAIYVANRVVGLSRFHDAGEQGAMIVYDRPCPIFLPDEPKDVESFVQQREELRKAVFDPSYVKHHSKYVSFWEQLSELAASS
ncbi:MAG: ATP-binding cassette domain-containing protein [Planctomycetales bacterium]|nr:ATP-binding cassette domain-containing protein [Planctomycetales bacterium]